MYIFDNLNLNKNNIMKLVKQLAHLYLEQNRTSCGEKKQAESTEMADTTAVADTTVVEETQHQV
jgi:hypothetical protein